MSNVASKSNVQLSFTDNDEFHHCSGVKRDVVEKFVSAAVRWLTDNLDYNLVNVITYGEQGEDVDTTYISYDGVTVFRSTLQLDESDYEFRLNKSLLDRMNSFL